MEKSADVPAIALYVHWPFCKSKCPYCDFNSHVREMISHERMCRAYIRELDYFVRRLGKRQVRSIYFGGGTPSLMEPETVSAILTHVAKCWNVSEDVEITLEANPTSIEVAKFKAFKNAGINRVSVGVQALDDEALAFLGREHSAAEAKKALEIAADTFDNMTFDLIYARPKQTVKQWQDELGHALSLGTKHLSLYQLTIEKGTPFYSRYHDAEFCLPDENTASDLYNVTEVLLAEAGLRAYEVSNYAVPGHESRHNMHYWTYAPYLGIGAGAHSRLDRVDGVTGRVALMLVHSPEKWLEQVEQEGAAIQQEQALSEEELLQEMLLMGLRLEEGIPRRRFVELLGKELEDVLRVETLSRCTAEGFLVPDENALRTTRKGRLVLNALVESLIP